MKDKTHYPVDTLVEKNLIYNKLDLLKGRPTVPNPPGHHPQVRRGVGEKGV